jgi:hypothetical protein
MSKFSDLLKAERKFLYLRELEEAYDDDPGVLGWLGAAVGVSRFPNRFGNPFNHYFNKYLVAPAAASIDYVLDLKPSVRRGYERSVRDLRSESSAITTSGDFKSYMPSRTQKKFNKPVPGRAPNRPRKKLTKKQRRIIALQNNQVAAPFRARVRRLNRARAMRNGLTGRGLQSIGPSMPNRPGQSRTSIIPYRTATSFQLGARIRQFSKTPNLTEVPIDIFDDVVSAIYPNSGSSVNVMAIGSSVADACNDYIITPKSKFYTPTLFRNTCISWDSFEVVNWSIEFKPTLGTTHSGEVIIASTFDPSLLVNMGMVFTCSGTTNNPRTSFHFTDGSVVSLDTIISDYMGNVSNSQVWGSGANKYDQIRNWTSGNAQLTQPFIAWKHHLKQPAGNRWKRNYLDQNLFVAGWDGKQQNTGDGPFNYFQAANAPADARLQVAGGFYIWGTLADNYQPTADNEVRKVGDLQLKAKIRYRGMSAATSDNQGGIHASRQFLPTGMYEKMINDPEFIRYLSDHVQHSSWQRKRLLREQKVADELYTKLQPPSEFVDDLYINVPLRGDLPRSQIGSPEPFIRSDSKLNRIVSKKSSSTKSEPH